jgi:L-rhamnose mutarotase
MALPRYCLLGRVDPQRLDEYRERHREVWPELLRALADAGWRNYSLFLRDDGLLIGYAEADDLAAAQERVARTEVNARWQASMSDLFAGLEGSVPDEAWEIVPEVFNLEDQLARANGSGAP